MAATSTFLEVAQTANTALVGAIQAQNAADEEAAAALAAEELRLRRRRLHAAAAMARLAQSAANDAVAAAQAAAAAASQALVQFNEAQNAGAGLTYMGSPRKRLLQRRCDRSPLKETEVNDPRNQIWWRPGPKPSP